MAQGLSGGALNDFQAFLQQFGGTVVRLDAVSGAASGFQSQSMTDDKGHGLGFGFADVYNTERDLLYVACTHARDHLLITATAPASEFLDEVNNSFLFMKGTGDVGTGDYVQREADPDDARNP